MRRKRLLWQLYPSFLAISLLSVGAVSWYASRVLYRFHELQTSSDLIARARLVVGPVKNLLESGDHAALSDFCHGSGRDTGTRITVIQADGLVLADSNEDAMLMDNHAGRPEVREALDGRFGTSTRYSETLRKSMVYAAVPVRGRDGVMAVVRMALPLFSLESTFRSIRMEILLGGTLLILLTAIAGFAISRWINQPIDKIRAGAERFAAGDLSGRIPAFDSKELGELAESLNSLASQLDQKIRDLEKQRNEQAAVMASMVEGVLAVDPEERIININSAAANLFRLNVIQVQGRGLREVIRNPALQDFVSRTLAGACPTEGDIVLHDGEEKYLQLSGARLRDAKGRSLGALIVMNDVTRLRRLENVRRDFVANVSHELKTPITSIKGFVETLADGAVDRPEDARRFLDIIARQADRLNVIIEDLLMLSRIEQDAEHGQVPLERQALQPVLAGAIQSCQIKAKEKQIRLDLSCTPELAPSINATLLEQSVVNLIDNAVKYSETGSEVLVAARSAAGEILITVTDHGCGIAPDHLPRLFERFYRVDKARSRQMGGTGLGLAIVKHIAQAHRGRVSVESAPGEGSAFTVHLPAI